MSLFFTKRFYIAAWLIVLLFVAAYIYGPLFVLAKIVFGLAWIAVGYDIWQMYWRNGEMYGRRECTERFSNGDENQVQISFCNPYPFRVGVEIIDEAPVQFQLRDLMLVCRLAANAERTIGYTVVPKRRGEYKFDRIRIFFTSPLGLVMRRFTMGESQTVKVYPSYTRLSNYAFLAIRKNLREYGIKKIRRVGVDTEFVNILGVKIPSLTIPVKPGRNLAVILEVAAMNNRQKKMGYNAAQELLHRLGMESDPKETVKNYESF